VRGRRRRGEGEEGKEEGGEGEREERGKCPLELNLGCATADSNN